MPEQIFCSGILFEKRNLFSANDLDLSNKFILQPKIRLVYLGYDPL